ncbi:MAG: rRNA maturation RNase YbeY [Actinomycetes bacterium]
MFDFDISGVSLLPNGPDEARIKDLLRLSFSSAGIESGHVAVEVVEETRITELNSEHRGLDKATDVLSFPVDGVDATVGPRELGDIVLCPPYCESVDRAIVHGALHLVGMDHEVDSGEMLALEAEILRWAAQ